MTHSLAIITAGGSADVLQKNPAPPAITLSSPGDYLCYNFIHFQTATGNIIHLLFYFLDNRGAASSATRGRSLWLGLLEHLFISQKSCFPILPHLFTLVLKAQVHGPSLSYYQSIWKLSFSSTELSSSAGRNGVIWTIGTETQAGNRKSCGEFLWLNSKVFTIKFFLKSGCNSQTKYPKICASCLPGDLFIYHHTCMAIWKWRLLHSQISRAMPQFPRKTQAYTHAALTLTMKCLQGGVPWRKSSIKPFLCGMYS